MCLLNEYVNPKPFVLVAWTGTFDVPAITANFLASTLLLISYLPLLETYPVNYR